MSIKVVHQNGCSHALCRVELERIIEMLPKGLDRFIKKIILYAGIDDEVYSKYYQKSKVFGLFCGPDQKNKSMVIDELIVGVDQIITNGDLLNKVSKNKRKIILKNYESLKRDCLNAINSIA